MSRAAKASPATPWVDLVIDAVDDLMQNGSYSHDVADGIVWSAISAYCFEIVNRPLPYMTPSFG